MAPPDPLPQFYGPRAPRSTPLCNFAGAGPVVLDGNGAGGQWERSHHQSEAGRTYNALVGELQFNTWPGWQCGHYEGAGTACPAQGRQVPHAVLGSPRAWADAYPKCQLMPREQTFRCFVAGDLQAVKPVPELGIEPAINFHCWRLPSVPVGGCFEPFPYDPIVAEVEACEDTSCEVEGAYCPEGAPGSSFLANVNIVC